MIKVLYAKSAIENEEGLNHLWIHLAAVGQVENVRLQLSLPVGIHRLRNLNGFREEQTGEIVIPNPRITNDIFIEIFTRELVTCGEKSISVAFCFNDEQGRVTRIEQFIPLKIIPEEEIDAVIVDEAVVNKIKDLRQQYEDPVVEEFIEYLPPKLIRIDSSHASEWEKKYRIEGIIQ